MQRSLTNIRARIEALNRLRDIPLIAKRLRVTRPDLFDQITQHCRGEQESELIIRGAAQAAFHAITTLPNTADAVLELCRSALEDQDPTVPTETCATLLAALAYLIKPKDILEDHLPGGYGFIDDVILLYASLEAAELPQAHRTWPGERRRWIRFLSVFLPPDAIPRLSQLIDDLGHLSQTLRTLPEDYLRTLCQQLQDDPLTIDLLQSSAKSPRSSLSSGLDLDGEGLKDVAQWTLTEQRYTVTLPVGRARLKSSEFEPIRPDPDAL